MRFQYLTLILLALFLAFILLPRGRKLPGRPFVAAIVVIMMVFLFHPDLSTELAHFFGIGLGVDFLFYVSHMFTFLLLFIFYLRTKTLETKLTRVVRALALHRAGLAAELGDASTRLRKDPPGE